jgi:hypothetical protein
MGIIMESNPDSTVDVSIIFFGVLDGDCIELACENE